MQPAVKGHLQQHAEHEAGQRHAGNRQAAHEMIDGRVGLDGGEHADGDADQDDADDGERGQLDRRHQPLADILQDGLAGQEAGAEIALGDLAEESQVLLPERQIEAELVLGGLDLIRRRPVPQHHLDRRARQDMRQHKGDGEHADQRAHHQYQALDDMARHVQSLFSLRSGPRAGQLAPRCRP